MSRLALCGGTLVDPEAHQMGEATLLVEDGLIVDRVEPDSPVGGDWRRVDLSDRFVAPGFVDLHFHGELAHAPVDAFAGALARSAARMLKGGTTTFLATSMAWPRETLCDALPALGASIAAPAPAAARCVGLHLEGPWISSESPGAMDASCMHGFDPGHDVDLLDRAGDALAMVTLAPELPGASALLAELGRRGVLPALGHTRAGRETIERAVAEGLRHVTHLFNAMGPMHHREVGVAGTALAHPHLHCDLICDGAHVHPDMVRVAARALNERLVLISDRVDLETPSEDDDARSEPNRLPDGTLLGSRLEMADAVANLRRFAGTTLHDAVAACTLRPARLIGREAECGTLRRGARADLAVMDADGQVVETWMSGRPVFELGATD
jgi:N-acetylglucosamine-6-phosphate deacetylase